MSTVNDRLAGVGSVLPAASVARTSNVCAPSASTAVVNGELHEPQAPPSTRHANVEPVSVAVNENVGVLSVVVPVGPAVIVVSGGVVSTVNDRLAGVGSVLPAASVARTSNVCAPSASTAVVNGVLHEPQAPPSTRHANVEPVSVAVNENVGVLSVVVPVGPAVIVVSGGVVSPGPEVSTVNDRLAGVGSVLPAASVARTSNVCAPSASTAVVNGVLHEPQAPPSTRHSNVEPVSVAVNENVGVLSVVVAVGPAVIVVSGGVVSTVNDRLAGVGSVLPAASVARTSKVCAPSASTAVVNGVLHEPQAPPSTRHSNVEPVSVAVNENVGVLSVVVPVGPAVIVVSGGVVSTVNDRLAGVGSVLPAASVARTSNVCAPSASTAVVNGVLHEPQAPPSTRHSNVEPVSVAVNENVGVLSVVVPVGPAVIVVSGGVVSAGAVTVTVTFAVSEPPLPSLIV